MIMSFEWVRPGKRRIQQVVSGMRLERFPLLKRCLAERQPVFLRRREPIDLNGEARANASLVFCSSAAASGTAG